MLEIETKTLDKYYHNTDLIQLNISQKDVENVCKEAVDVMTQASYCCILDNNQSVVYHNKVENIGTKMISAQAEDDGMESMELHRVIYGGVWYEEISLPIFSNQQQKIGELRMGISQKVIREKASKIRNYIILVTLFCLFLELLLGIFFSNLYTRPLKKFSNVVQGYKDGDFRTRIPVEEGKEFGNLSHVFNEMAQSIEQRESEILKSHQVLENRVNERTEELKSLSEQLRDEKEKLEAIINGSPIPQFLINKNHEIVLWNAAMESRLVFLSQLLISHK